ncbi:glycosyltransferase [Salipiger mangrovisoli]|uniref:Glycosyl transferase family 28 C-terminal domain-containing protein n=1 Tax=Salipiger mangrovisoli TaxID=2865933 RepID=A0ABR9XAE6_9RHOB|nr:glycosyltransferase [Salipiger mangrovisoli]MBE9640454.1 hypothetical protein [Salipiger mangrovisoli]
MIFATVGTQLPFPRLIDALEALAPELGEAVIAQTGLAAGSWPHLDVRPRLAPKDFAAIFEAARVVVSHAGVGSILSARRYRKPLIVMPRRLALGEHRNDHQMATARHVEGLHGVHVAWEAEELRELLRRPGLEAAAEKTDLSPSHSALIQRVQAFIREAG